VDTKAVHQNEEKGLLKIITQIKQKIKVMLVLFLILLALVGCGEEYKPTPIISIAPTMLPPSLMPSLTVSPATPVIVTPTITSNPTVTPLPEGTIVLNWGYSVVPSDPESIAKGENWAQGLSSASGFNVVALPGPSTDMEILKALRDGKIHMASINALAFGYGLAQGWIMPGPVMKYTYQPSGSIMFVARIDSGLVPGEPPDVFQQLAGKHPCWPDSEGAYQNYPPVKEYFLPAGLLAQAGVKLGQPVFITHTSTGHYESEAVFLRECDFAVVEAEPEETFLNMMYDYLLNRGVTFTEWKEQMQVLYTTQPLEPYHTMAFSSKLEESKIEKLTNALLNVPAVYPEYHWLPFDEKQKAFYDQFQSFVGASGVDVVGYLNRLWGHYLQSLLNDTQTPSPTPIAPNPEALVIDVSIAEGSIPWLPFSQSEPLGQMVMAAIYAELARLDKRGNYIPYLAQELPTFENGLVRFVGQGEDEHMEVEFHLRPGVTWQDGTTLTAEDLVFSWQLVMQPDWPGSHWGASGLASEVYVQDVEALSPERVVYRFMSQRQARLAAQIGGRLGDPTQYIDLVQQEGAVVPLEYLNVGRNVFPKHLLADIPAGKIAESDFARHPVYAGAYRLTLGGEDDQPVVLEAFESFVKGAPDIRQVVFGAIYSYPQASTYWQNPIDLAGALQANAVQAQLGLPGVNSRQGEDPHAYDTLAEQSLAKVNWVGRNGWETLDFNLDNPHLADLKVRQAIAHAIDRQAIIDLVLAGHGSMMRSYLPDWHPYYAGDEALPDYDFNPAIARLLLDEAGYDLSQFPAVHPTRGELVLKLDSMDVASYPRSATANLIRQELADVGIQVNVQFYAWTDFEGQDCSVVRNGRKFDLGMAGWLGIGRYDTWYVEHVTASWNIPTGENGCPFEKANWSGWRNTRVDELIPMLEDGRLLLEYPDKYRRLWVEHQQLWSNELPSLPLFNWQRPVVTIPNLSGVQPSPFFSTGTEDTWNIFEWVWR
jgi:peptide/nickel transport system substrate-binding protein